MFNDNPIISMERREWYQLFRPRPHPKPGVALVLYDEEKRRMHTCWPFQRKKKGGRFAYQWLYKVDVSEQHLEIECNLPTTDPEISFDAKVTLIFCVSSPEKIVRRDIQSNRALLAPLAVQLLRDYFCNRAGGAACSQEEAIRQELTQQNNLFEQWGYQIEECFIELTRIQAAPEFQEEQAAELPQTSPANETNNS